MKVRIAAYIAAPIGNGPGISFGPPWLRSAEQVDSGLGFMNELRITEWVEVELPELSTEERKAQVENLRGYAVEQAEILLANLKKHP